MTPRARHKEIALLMHDEHSIPDADPLVEADRLLTETWEALREYRKDLAPEHAEMVDALLGVKYLLEEV